jgi:putative DNA primase/helicase
VKTEEKRPVGLGAPSQEDPELTLSSTADEADSEAEIEHTFEDGSAGESEDAAVDRAVVRAHLDQEFRKLSKQHVAQARAAYQMAADSLEKLIHVAELGWMYWDGRRWALDVGEKHAQNAALKTIRTMAKWARKDDNKELLRDLAAIQRASGVAGVLKLASSQAGISVAVDELDDDPYSLNCANGILDLRTCVLRPHDPGEYHTKVTRASYDPTATSGVLQRYLDTSLPDVDVRDFLMRYLASPSSGRCWSTSLCLPPASAATARACSTSPSSTSWVTTAPSEPRASWSTRSRTRMAQARPWPTYVGSG